MSGNRIIPACLVLMSLGVAATTILGPLAIDVIDYRFSENMENQTIGGDAVLLFVVVPVALIAAYLWSREHRLAPLLAFSAAAFTAYTFLGFILIPDYAQYDGDNERYYPLFASVLALAAVVSAASWSAAARIRLPEPSKRLRRITAGVLLAIAILVVLTWSRQIADVIGGEFSSEYLEHPTAFWLIRTLDFAFVIPASIAAGVGLLRDDRTALRAACALTGFLTLMMASIASMALVLVVRDDAASDPAGMAVFALVAAGLALLTWKLWHAGVETTGEQA